MSISLSFSSNSAGGLSVFVEPMMKILLPSTLFVMLFPWVSFGLLSLDTQPWFIIMATIFFFVNFDKKLHKSIFFSLFLFVCVIFVGLIYRQLDFLFARAVLSYYSFFLVLSSYYIMKRYYILPVWVIVASNFIWLLAGGVQTFFGKDVLSFLVHVRTTDDRGVTGLAPEPTFYGIFLFFLCWLLYLERGDIPKRIYVGLVFSNIFFIFFIAKSSMVILFLLIAMVLYTAFNLLSIRRVVVVAVAASLAWVLTFNFGYLFEGTRVFKLVSIVAEAPLFVIERDASMNERVSHIFFSVRSFFYDYGVPHGFHSFSQVLSSGREEVGSIFWWGGVDNKIMSGLGAILFEMGVFSILFFISVFWLMLSKVWLKQSLFGLVLLLGLYFSAIPMSFTLLPIIIISTHFYFIRKPCGT